MCSLHQLNGHGQLKRWALVTNTTWSNCLHQYKLCNYLIFVLGEKRITTMEHSRHTTGYKCLLLSVEWNSGRDAALNHQRSGFNPVCGSERSLYILPMWVFSGCSAFLPNFKDVPGCRLIGFCTLSLVYWVGNCWYTVTVQGDVPVSTLYL